MKYNSKFEALAHELEQSSQYKVLRRITGFAREQQVPKNAELARGAFVDVETTGLNTATDHIIEIGVVTFQYDRSSGEIYHVDETFSQFQDPGISIPQNITEITGITNEMVEDQRIDKHELERLFADVALVIAHNASFDRPFLERLHPLFIEKPWACTVQDVPWRQEGIRGSKLEYLAINFGYFFDAHRALDDCLAGLTVLSCQLPKSDASVMSKLLESARGSILRFEATGAPFEMKDLLRQRGYRWNRDKRVWMKDVASSNATEEFAWLKSNIFPNGVPEPQEFTAFEKYSSRLK